MKLKKSKKYKYFFGLGKGFRPQRALFLKI